MRAVGLELGLGPAVVVLVVAGLVLVATGTRFTKVVDTLADRTGIGEALAGAVLVGAVTSLPGLITTVVGASSGDADLAVSNAMGGIAAQTAFLAIADLTYRRANLEHAAASLANLVQALMLVSLSAVVLLGITSPDVTVLGVHPVTVLLPVIYLYGLRLARAVDTEPMWQVTPTDETRSDEPDESEEADQRTTKRLWSEFGVLAVLVGATGYAVARAGLAVIAETGLSSSLVGAAFTAVVTSLPELVTVIVAVRIGALTLAVGDILGGNAFDVLFVAGGDIAFRGGSIYHATGQSTSFVIGVVLLMTAVLAAGLVRRQEKGIGFEGFTMLGVYGGGLAILATTG